MKPHFIYPSNYIILFLSLFLFFVTTVSATHPYPDDTINGTRIYLKGKYDSLDLEKQKHKRNGLTINELELQQDAIRDSLKAIQQHIQNSSPFSKPVTIVPIKLSALKPQGIFDWIILVVGAIAILSGIFLLYGIFSIVSNNHGKRRTQQRETGKTKASTKTTQSPPSIQSMAALKALSNIASDPVIKLRQQMQSNESSSVSIPPSGTDSNSTNSTTNHSTTKTIMSQQEAAIRQKVVKAADSGMSQHDISRIFHISEDHVALILKVTGRKNR